MNTKLIRTQETPRLGITDSKRGFTFTAFLFFLLTACSGPATKVSVAGREVEVPKETAEQHQKVIESIGLYNDPELTQYVRDVGNRLLRHADLREEDFSFAILDSPMINAMALPGGYIYVSRGLMAYLNSEAELAGVIGHEIGHITKKHYEEKKFERGVLDTTTTITSLLERYVLNPGRIISYGIGTGTPPGQIASAIEIYGVEVISGYGRERELEADQVGAELLHLAGYDAGSMLATLGVLKDHESYEKAKAKEKGTKSPSYHGLYASHPRNDLRLKTVIKTANQLDIDNQPEDPELPGEYRRKIQGMVFGASADSQSEENRFYHNKLDFTFRHPEGWTVTQGAREIVAASPDGASKLTISLSKLDAETTPGDFLGTKATGELSEQRELEQFGLKGSTALASAGGKQERLAVIDHKYRFLFEGETPDLAGTDEGFLGIIESFRALVPREKVKGDSRNIHYVQVPRGATLKSLSTSARIPDAEDQLRLINGYYPSGEPRIGDWIKVIR